jgi:hypothetical protein
LFLTWGDRQKNLKLYCSERQYYIYWNEMSDEKVRTSTIQHNPTPGLLVDRLEWLFAAGLV